MIDISIITTVYNKEKYLPNTIRSFRQLTDNFVKEFIFIDDKSTDSSLEILNDLQKDASLQNLKIISNPQNYGPSKSTNIATENCCGKYIMIIDGDDMFAGNGLTVIMKIMEKEKADLLDFSSKSMQASEMDKISNYTMPEEAAYSTYKKPVEVFYNSVPGGSHYIFKREVLEKAGKICDERLFVQDHALAANLIRCSIKLVLLKDPALLYAVKTDNAISTDSKQCDHDKSYNFYLMINEKRFENRRAYCLTGKQILKKAAKLCEAENNYKAAKKYKNLAKILKYMPRKFMIKHFENAYLAYQKYGVRLMRN